MRLLCLLALLLLPTVTASASTNVVFLPGQSTELRFVMERPGTLTLVVYLHGAAQSMEIDGPGACTHQPVALTAGSRTAARISCGTLDKGQQTMRIKMGTGAGMASIQLEGEAYWA